MHQKLVKHCIGIQGLWQPYSVAYRGDKGAYACESADSGDRVLLLDRLCERVLNEVGDVFNGDETVLLAFPCGPGPFTGLRAVGAFAHGVRAARSHIYFCTPSVFAFYGNLLAHKKEVLVSVPHHKNAVFQARCFYRQGVVEVQDLQDVSRRQAPKTDCSFYTIDGDGAPQPLPELTAQMCADYAWYSREGAEDFSIQYP